jgi:hypothetical protein
MPTDDGTFFGTTDEEELRDWLDWGERFVRAFLLASQRISLAIAAGGFAIAGSNLIDKSPRLGQVSLGAAGVFGVWIVVASIADVTARR